MVLTHSLNFFIITKRISDWHSFCKWKVLYIVISAGGSLFCWSYVTDTLYSDYTIDKVCCNYAGFGALLQLCRWYFLLQLCWWIFLLQSCMWLFLLQLCRSKFLQHLCSFCIKCVGDNSYCIYAGGSLCSNYAGGPFCSAQLFLL